MNELKKEIQELEERRNKNLERVKLEIFEKVDESINNRIEHFETAPKTKILIRNVKEIMDKHISEQKLYECSTKDILDYQTIMIKEIQKNLKEMSPSYRMLKNIATTGEVLTKFGKFLLWVVVFLTTIIGAVMSCMYAFKNWINR